MALIDMFFLFWNLRILLIDKEVVIWNFYIREEVHPYLISDATYCWAPADMISESILYKHVLKIRISIKYVNTKLSILIECFNFLTSVE